MTGGAWARRGEDAVNLNLSKDEIMREVEESVRKHGKTGFIDPTLLRERKVLTTGDRQVHLDVGEERQP